MYTHACINCNCTNYVVVWLATIEIAHLQKSINFSILFMKYHISQIIRWSDHYYIDCILIIHSIITQIVHLILYLFYTCNAYFNVYNCLPFIPIHPIHVLTATWMSSVVYCFVVVFSLPKSLLSFSVELVAFCPCYIWTKCRFCIPVIYWFCKEMRLYGFIKNAVKKGNNSYYLLVIVVEINVFNRLKL
jgi:hypothetical protein